MRHIKLFEKSVRLQEYCFLTKCSSVLRTSCLSCSLKMVIAAVSSEEDDEEEDVDEPAEGTGEDETEVLVAKPCSVSLVFSSPAIYVCECESVCLGVRACLRIEIHLFYNFCN